MYRGGEKWTWPDTLISCYQGTPKQQACAELERRGLSESLGSKLQGNALRLAVYAFN
jgi:hypothetical protein